MVIVVVVKVRLVEVGSVVVTVVKLAEGDGTRVVVVQVVIVENRAASDMLTSMQKKSANRPKIGVKSFMIGEACTDVEVESESESMLYRDLCLDQLKRERMQD